MPRRKKLPAPEEIEEAKKALESELPKEADPIFRKIIPKKVLDVLIEEDTEVAKQVLELALEAEKYELFADIDGKTLMKCVYMLNHIRKTFLEPLEASALEARLRAPLRAVTEAIKEFTQLQEETLKTGVVSESVYRAIYERVMATLERHPEIRQRLEQETGGRVKPDLLTQLLTQFFFKVFDKLGDEIIDELKKYGVSEELAKAIIVSIQAGMAQEAQMTQGAQGG